MRGAMLADNQDDVDPWGPAAVRGADLVERDKIATGSALRSILGDRRRKSARRRAADVGGTPPSAGRVRT